MTLIYVLITLMFVVPFAMIFSLGIAKSYRRLGVPGPSSDENDRLVYHWDAVTGEREAVV